MVGGETLPGSRREASVRGCPVGRQSVEMVAWEPEGAVRLFRVTVLRVRAGCSVGQGSALMMAPSTAPHICNDQDQTLRRKHWGDWYSLVLREVYIQTFIHSFYIYDLV